MASKVSERPSSSALSAAFSFALSTFFPIASSCSRPREYALRNRLPPLARSLRGGRGATRKRCDARVAAPAVAHLPLALPAAPLLADASGSGATEAPRCAPPLSLLSAASSSYALSYVASSFLDISFLTALSTLSTARPIPATMSLRASSISFFIIDQMASRAPPICFSATAFILRRDSPLPESPESKRSMASSSRSTGPSSPSVKCSIFASSSSSSGPSPSSSSDSPLDTWLSSSSSTPDSPDPPGPSVASSSPPSLSPPPTP
mmetsp:Transcript_39212/g.124929  ORF Transcript_39212/g.124929 Transcript_39212/m.124929 type:complete len:264 (-) Transcript_39212:121-912(-)